MLIIGLTGGIGSGKTTVANLFAELGISIIDADQVAREVVEPSTSALQQITARYGQQVITMDGQLNRSKLRDIIFASASEREWLETLLHPLIRARMHEYVTQAKSPYCILVIPLLLESKPNELVQRILVVDTPEKSQISRTLLRDKSSAEQIQQIMASQVSRSQRLAAADDVIINDSNLTTLKSQVENLHRQYLDLAT